MAPYDCVTSRLAESWQLALSMKFDSVLDAREWTRYIMAAVKTHKGSSAKASRYFDVEYHGFFMVELVFYGDIGEREVLQILNPPCSNRGVTS